MIRLIEISSGYEYMGLAVNKIDKIIIKIVYNIGVHIKEQITRSVFNHLNVSSYA